MTPLDPLAWKQLVDAILKEKCILFLGPGVTVNYPCTGQSLATNRQEVFFKELATQYEGDSDSAWDPRGLPAHVSKLSAIVGFEIAITNVEGKLKLSQNRSVQDQENVIAKLKASDASEVRATAKMMEQNLARK